MFSSLISDELRQYRREGWIWATVLEPQGGSSNSPHTPTFSLLHMLLSASLEQGEKACWAARLAQASLSTHQGSHLPAFPPAPAPTPVPSIPLRDSKLSILPCLIAQEQNASGHTQRGAGITALMVSLRISDTSSHCVSCMPETSITRPRILVVKQGQLGLLNKGSQFTSDSARCSRDREPPRFGLCPVGSAGLGGSRAGLAGIPHCGPNCWQNSTCAFSTVLPSGNNPNAL